MCGCELASDWTVEVIGYRIRDERALAEQTVPLQIAERATAIISVVDVVDVV